MNQDKLITINKKYKIIEIKDDSNNSILFELNHLDKIK